MKELHKSAYYAGTSSYRHVYGRTWAEIDLDALSVNYQAIRARLQPGTKLCCVVKADAYGHGAICLATALQALGADFLAVSNIDEALQLRGAGIHIPLLILGYTPVDACGLLSAQDIAQCVYSTEYGKALSQAAAREGCDIAIHIKIDTGMNRLGLSCQRPEDCSITAAAVNEICKLPNLVSEGIFTHFSVSDEGDQGTAYTLQQFSFFKKLLENLARLGLSFSYVHCSNSAAILDYPLAQMNMVRAGIILYGLYPSADIAHRPALSPVLSLKSVISQIKTVSAGSDISYGRIYTTTSDTKIATIPIGYADGYPRILGNRGAEVLIKGKRCKILGRICMDQLMADVTGLEDLQIGQEVTLIGRSGEAFISADEIASYEDTINYEVVCDIGKRVPRVFIRNGKIVGYTNDILSSSETPCPATFIE